ncbi:MAG: phosphatidate cytidylyltransferase [Halioglobus sp.]|nr:phosphatidate cytidylyltransferase [Halioglobus sp.]
MLKQRVITALIMAGLFLAAIAYVPVPGLALLFGVLVALGAWEWSNMAGWRHPVARGLYVLLVACALVAVYVYCRLGEQPSRLQVQPLLGLACLWWSFALLWVKGYPASAVFWRTVVIRSAMGLLILVPGWMAAVYLLSFPPGGLLMVVLVIVVASADIGAYFSGKQFGRHKLAVLVSPAKTWEGFWGGVAACTLLAVLLWYLLPERAAHIGMASVVAVILSTSLASVIGDLTVSMVKRESGVKDSGSLLPGHGGVLDRLDSLCAAAPVFALGLLLAGW